jgi:hypothetical protein
MSILIGVPTADMARQAEFYDYFNALDKPLGTIITFAHGQSPARGRNLIIQQAIKHDCSHIMFFDDDVRIPSDALNRLLAHDKDIVTGLYLMRNSPHQPIIFDIAYDDGKCRFVKLTPEHKGLIEIVACGLGCCLIKTDVFRQMEEPWIRLGECEPDNWCDDIGFFNRARKQGYKLYCDLDVRVGHMAAVTLLPTRDANGNWHVTYDTRGISAPSMSLDGMWGQTAS